MPNRFREAQEKAGLSTLQVATKPISYEDLKNYKSLWVRPISPDSLLRDESSGWYEVHDFYIQNQYGTRFLFDTYGTKWLALETEF